MTTQYLEIPHAEIQPNPRQPRTVFNDAELNELADSIRAHGIKQPLRVLQTRDQAAAAAGPLYTIIMGERRWRAAGIVGLATVPCVIETTDPTDQQLLEWAVIENVQRVGLTPADEARAYQHLHDDFGLTDDQIAARVGKARSTVANMRRLAELPAGVLNKVGEGEGQMPARYARQLITVARVNPNAAIEIATDVARSDDADRHDTFGEGMQGVLKKSGRSLSGLPFDDKWKTKDTLQLDGEAVPMPACAGCAFNLKIDWQKYCTRPACLDAKLRLYKDSELNRVAKATGIMIAHVSDKLHPLPKDGYNTIEPGKRMLESKHFSLRLTLAGTSSTTTWENEHITGSSVVRLMTTDPDALAKDLKIKPKTEPTQADYEAQRQRHKAAEDAIVQAIALAAPAFVKVMPDNRVLLNRLVNMLSYTDYMPGDLEERINVRKKSAKASDASFDDLRLYLACAVISEDISLPHDSVKAIVAKDPIEKIAADLKVKLPAGWDEPLKMKPTEAAALKKPAAKSKKN